MRNSLIRKFAVGLVAASLLAVPLSLTLPVAAAPDQPQPGAQTGDSSTAAMRHPHGCPDGAVCIYPRNAGWNNDRPSHVYWSYGYHNLSNQYGIHRIYNWQTGGATARTCTGYNGTGCQGYLVPGQYIDKDLTPINSITLQP